MNSAKLQDTKFMYKNHVAFLHTNSEHLKEKLRK